MGYSGICSAIFYWETGIKIISTPSKYIGGVLAITIVHLQFYQ